jgi:predicted Zn-dependent peptidase
LFKAQASLTSQLLTEGTKRHSSEEIYTSLDFYGAHIQTRCSPDEGSLSLYCLSRHLSACLETVAEVLKEAAFHEADFQTTRDNNIQKLLVKEQKNDFLARRHFYAEVFGETHPYGNYVTVEDYKKIRQADLADFFHSRYQNGIKHLIVSGAAGNDTVDILKSFFDAPEFRSGDAAKSAFSASQVKNSGRSKMVEKAGSLQSALRIGRRLFTRNHPDFRRFQLLNLVLGGYFGSRLMKNLREEKGLTYGIYSAVESLQDDGCFYVDTDLNDTQRDEGLNEIYSEIELLRTEPIGTEELETARNYMLGAFLRSVDGPFSLAERLKILLDFGFSYSYYYDFVETIKNTSALELQELANKYLNKETLVEIVVGNKS